jgi:hypothetical protein
VVSVGLGSQSCGHCMSFELRRVENKAIRAREGGQDRAYEQIVVMRAWDCLRRSVSNWRMGGAADAQNVWLQAWT